MPTLLLFAPPVNHQPTIPGFADDRADRTRLVRLRYALRRTLRLTGTTVVLGNTSAAPIPAQVAVVDGATRSAWFKTSETDNLNRPLWAVRVEGSPATFTVDTPVWFNGQLLGTIRRIDHRWFGSNIVASIAYIGQ